MRPVAEATAGTAAVPAARRLRSGAMGSYAFGAVAYGVKDAGFGTFLLLFYNQVVGLPSATVGLVMSSEVGPNPPETSTRSARPEASRTAWRISSARSATV